MKYGSRDLPARPSNPRVRQDTLVKPLDGSSVMPDRAIPQVTGSTVRNIRFKPSLNIFSFGKRLLIFFTVFPSQYAKTGSTSSAFSCEGCASCLYLMKNQVSEPLKGKTGSFPSYFRLSATATATATVAPTMGLLPMPRKPIISTCAGTEEEPANCASECMRPMVSVMP